MIKRNCQFILLFISLFGSQIGVSQNNYQLPNIIPASPGAQNFQRYGEIPVDYSTGVPSISIPLYDVSSRKLSLPISISYHASGIKVTDKSSPIGLGWVLNAGGMMSVTVQSVPDSNGATLPITYKTADALNAAREAVMTDWEDLRDFGELIENQKIRDWQSDRYYYQLPDGRSGVFRYDFVTNQLIQIPYTPLKIEKYTEYYPSTTTLIITGFKITDENGTSYTFKLSQGWEAQGASMFCLSSIVSADRTDTIRFVYKNSNWVKTSSYVSVIDFGDYIENHTDDWQLSVNFSASAGIGYAVSVENVLDSIISASTIVTFSGVDDRADLEWSTHRYRINKLSIYDRFSSNLIKEYTFNQSYFGNSQNNNRRLRLDSLNMKGSIAGTIESYKFDYDTTVQLPPYPEDITTPYRFSEDYWGYYNGESGRSLVPSDFVPDTALAQKSVIKMLISSEYSMNRNPNHAYAKAALIKSIQYPTGGKTVFEFEPNYSGAGVYSYAHQPPTGNVGGFRIYQILNYTDSAKLAWYKTYTYPPGKTRTIEYGLFGYAQRNMADPYYQTCYHWRQEWSRNIITSSSFLPLTADNGPPVFYDSVTEYNGDVTGILGRTVYEYQAPPDIPDIIDYPRFYHPYQPDYGNYSPRLFKKTIFTNKNSQYSPIEKTINTYSTFLSQQYNMGVHMVQTSSYPGGGWALDYQAAVWPPYGGGDCSNFATPGHATFFNFYDVKATQELNLLTKTEVYTYAPDTTQKLITTTLYSYDTATHLQVKQQISFDSNNDSLKTNFKYPIDYAGTAAYDSMIKRNIIAPIIAQSRYKNSNFLDSVKTNYYNWTSSFVSPQTVESKVLTNNLETRLRFIAYDAKGNTLSVSKENDIKNSYIWDYNNSYPIAQVVNADTGSIAYTSFEADGKGNWSFSGTPVTNYTAPTGEKAYTLTGWNDITKSGLNTSSTYIVSYWTMNGSAYSISGTISGYPISGRSVNGWKYFEYKITGQSALTISGTGTIDELRLYPATAQMITYCYKPLIGMQSQCDANNRITYFEYDNFNRLFLIRDQDKNIVKKLCYNYAGQPEACSVYGNVQKSGNFTRNNCGAGYIGSTVTYTIPANSYYSFTSQSEADTKAQGDVDQNGQAYANNNGTCTQVWYNTQQSGNFTPTNCTSGYSGLPVTFLVYANTYSSTVSQAAADQLAINAVTAGGQNYANTNGTCSANGSFTMNSGWSKVTSGMSSSVPASGGTHSVSFYIAFYYTTGSPNWGTGTVNTIATISTTCRPSSNKQQTISAAGCSWRVTVTTGGSFQVERLSGTAPTNQTVVSLTGGSYSW
jgi:hypothetical protein